MTHPGDHHARRRVLHQAAVLATVLICIGALNGCTGPESAPITEAIRTPPQGDLQLVETQPDPSAHSGATVRWGGNVIQVERDSAGNALIQVIERRLDAYGRPIEGSSSDGRFMIRATANVDPQFYARDRLITVAGIIDGSASTHVGNTPLLLPVVRVSEFMLWPIRLHDAPYWRHDYPWYGPRVHFGIGVNHYRHSHRH